MSNTVVVKKKNGKWRVCVNLTSLNRACLKICFPLPKIDKLVDSTSDHACMSIFDAYRGFHQIGMHGRIGRRLLLSPLGGIFGNKVMPFGLKNAGATYHRMITKMFRHLMGSTMDAYINDMVVKSMEE